MEDVFRFLFCMTEMAFAYFHTRYLTRLPNPSGGLNVELTGPPLFYFYAAVRISAPLPSPW